MAQGPASIQQEADHLYIDSSHGGRSRMQPDCASAALIIQERAVKPVSLRMKYGWLRNRSFWEETIMETEICNVVCVGYWIAKAGNSLGLAFSVSP